MWVEARDLKKKSEEKRQHSKRKGTGPREVGEGAGEIRGLWVEDGGEARPGKRASGSRIPQRPVGSGLAPAKATHSLTAQRSPQPAASLRPRGRRSPTKPPALASAWAAFASAVLEVRAARANQDAAHHPRGLSSRPSGEWVRSRIPPPASLRMCCTSQKHPKWGGWPCRGHCARAKPRLRPQTSYTPKQTSPGHRTARACSGPACLYLALCPTDYARETLTDAPPHFPSTSRTLYARANVGISEYPSAAC